MKIILASLVVTLIACSFTASSFADENVDKKFTKQISDILTECKKITSGTKRAELLKVFATEGGISNAKHRTFVHRRCPYVKIDVDFTLSDPKQSLGKERDTDTISKISKPYLEWSTFD